MPTYIFGLMNNQALLSPCTCKMSNGEVRKVSLHDVQLVQNLIERCLQLYMRQEEVVHILLQQAKIEPDFTELVWQRLEAQNQEFFRAYHLRLIVKDQIFRFNQLLERQAQMMHQMSHYAVVPTVVSQTHSMHYEAAYHDRKPTLEYIKAENMQQVINDVANVYTNSTSSVQQCMQPGVDMGGLGRIDVHGNMPLAQSTNAGLMQGFNPGMKKTEADHSSDSLVMFGPDNNLQEPHHVFREAPISCFGGGDSIPQIFSDPMFESIGHLGQMTRSFSLCDLTTADFPNSTSDFPSYSRLPYLGTDMELWDFHMKEEEQEIRTLDGLKYKDFGTEWP